jgi:hypothetical protein
MKDSTSPTDVIRGIRPALEALSRSEKIGPMPSKTFLHCAIQYEGNNIPLEVSNDIVTLAVDSFQRDINIPFKGKTFLEQAIDCGNEYARDLLIQKGAIKN